MLKLMNNLSSKNFQKVESAINDLNRLQSRCTARTFSNADIYSFVNQAIDTKKDLLQDSLNRKYFKQIEIMSFYDIPNSYKWRTETSFVSVIITKYGKIKIRTGRYKADNKPYGGFKQKTKVIYN